MKPHRIEVTFILTRKDGGTMPNEVTTAMKRAAFDSTNGAVKAALVRVRKAP